MFFPLVHCRFFVAFLLRAEIKIRFCFFHKWSGVSMCLGLVAFVASILFLCFNLYCKVDRSESIDIYTEKTKTISFNPYCKVDRSVRRFFRNKLIASNLNCSSGFLILIFNMSKN